MATNGDSGNSFLVLVLLSRVEEHHNNANVTQCVDPVCPFRNALGTNVHLASGPGISLLFPEQWLVFASIGTGSASLAAEFGTTAPVSHLTYAEHDSQIPESVVISKPLENFYLSSLTTFMSCLH